MSTDLETAEPDGTRPPRGGGWWARRVSVVVGVLVLAVALVVGLSVWSFDRSIDRVDVQGLGDDGDDGTTEDGDGEDEDEHDDGAEASEVAEPLTVLVLGSDSREDLTPEERREFRTGDDEGIRTEVVSLVRIAPGEDELRVLNVPRDSRIELCDGSLGRVNTAYEIGLEDGRGGATCVVQTLDMLLGVDIDHVVTVDFRGFVEVVDELGGVSIYLDEPLRDRGSHLDLEAGCVTLDGTDALAFVRARQLDDDYGRIARQHRLVEEVRRELADLGVLQDLPRLLRVTETVARSVELDRSLTLNRIQQLVREHRDSVQGELVGRAVPGVVEEVGEALMLDIDEERARELAVWLTTGDDPAELTAPPATGSAVESAAADDDESGTSEADEAADDDGPRTLGGRTPAGLSGGDEPAC